MRKNNADNSTLNTKIFLIQEKLLRNGKKKKATNDSHSLSELFFHCHQNCSKSPTIFKLRLKVILKISYGTEQLIIG